MIAVADAVHADALRLRHEFLTLPDLQMSATACADLLNVSPRHAIHLLESLVQEGFLQRRGDRYSRA
jgi:hypothetical protein